MARRPAHASASDEPTAEALAADADAAATLARQAVADVADLAAEMRRSEDRLRAALDAHEARDVARHAEVVGVLADLRASGRARGEAAERRERMLLGLVLVAVLVLALVALRGEGVEASGFGVGVAVGAEVPAAVVPAGPPAH